MLNKKYRYVLLISILFITYQANASILNIAVNDLDGKPAGGVVFQIFKGEINIDDNMLPIILGGVKDGMDNDGDGQIDESIEDLLGYATFPDGKLQLNLPDGLYTLVGFSQSKHFLFVTKVSVPGSVIINAKDAVPVNISCRASDGSPIKTAEVFFRPTKRARASVGYSDNNGQIKAYISPGEYNIVLWAVSGLGPHYLILPNFVVSKPEKSVALHVADMPTTVLRFDLPKTYAVAMFEVLESTYTIEYAEGLEPEIGYDAAYTDFYPAINAKMPFTLSANINYNFNMSFALTFGKGIIYAYEIRPSVHLLMPGEMRIGTTESEKFSLYINTERGNVNPIYHPGENIKLFYNFADSKGNILSRILNFTGARLVFPMVTIFDPNGTPIANNIDTIIFNEFEFALPKSSIAGEYRAEISLDAGLYGIIKDNFRFRVQPFVDNNPPLIEIIQIPEQIEAGEKIAVSAKITDEINEIKESPIFRIFNDSASLWTDFQMSLSNEIYQTIIPSSFVTFGDLNWQIIAEDSASNKKTISGTIKVVDTEKPTIKHDIISKAELGLDLLINADITDNSAIKEAILFYILPNSQTKSITMSKTSGSRYFALINGLDVIDGIVYYISATDLAENKAFMPSELNLPKPAKISVQDTLPPLIEHNPIKLAIAETPLIIQAIINDNSNYVESTLYYKNEINSNYKSVKMINQGGFHFAEIPIDDVIIGKLNYHISAQDLPDQSGKTRSSQSPTTGDYSIDVISSSKGNLADIEIFPTSSSTNPIIIGAGDRIKFSAIGKTDSNDSIPVDVVWISTDGVGYISQDGSFLATGKIIGEGKGKIIATSINNNIVQAEAWVQIVPKQPSKIRLNPSSVIAIAGDQMTFSTTITDIYNNPIQAEIKWRLDSSDGIGDIATTKGNQCILSFHKTGNGKLIAEYNELSTISDITVIASKLSRITIAEINNRKSPFIIKAGNSLQFVASGFDSFGNKIRIFPSWSVIGNIGKIDSNGTFIGGIAGKGKIMATVANISATQDIEVTTGELAYVSVSPYTAYIPVTTSKYKSTQQFTAIGHDIAGNIVQLKSVSWSTDELAGTIDKNGLFTAITDPGVRIGEVITNGTIYANGVSSTGRVIQGTGYIVVQRLPTSLLTSVRVFIQGTSGASPKVSTATGKSIQFEATGSDIAGRDISINPTWSVIGGIGNIDVNGKFTATKAGSGFVVATAGGYNGQIAVDVTVGLPNSIKIKPDFLSLTSGTKQSISVTGYDSYENIVPIDNVKWSSDNSSIRITPKGNSCEVELISNPQESSGIISAVVGDLIAYANVFMPISDVKINTENIISSSNNPYYFRITPELITLKSGASYRFSAQAFDVLANSIQSENLFWSITGNIGTIDQSGVFSAIQTENNRLGQIIVTDGKVYGIAKVMIMPDIPKTDEITIIPDNVNLSAGKNQVFLTLISHKDEKGKRYFLPSAIPSWRVIGNIGKIDSTGKFTSSNIGEGFVEASLNSITKSSPAKVSFGNIKNIVISPSIISLKSSDEQKIGLTAIDDMGNIQTLECKSPDCSIQISSGLGVVSQNSVFSAQNIGSGYMLISKSDVLGKADVSIIQNNVREIIINPNNQTVSAGGFIKFSAIGRDSFGNIISINPIWEADIGLIGSDGSFAANKVGSGKVYARFGGLSASSNINVVSASPSFILVDPPLVSISSQTAERRQFKAIFEDVWGNIINVSNAESKWSVTEGIGTIDSNTGVFINVTGLTESRTGYINVIARFNIGTPNEFSLTGRSAVIIQPNIKPLTTITVTPNPVNVIRGDSQKFTATGKNDDGLEVEFKSQWRLINIDSGVEKQDVISVDGILRTTPDMQIGSKWKIIASTQNSEGKIIQGEAIINIITGPLQTIEIACENDACNKPIESGKAIELTAIGYDSFRNAIDISSSWKISNPIGTISGTKNKATFVAGSIGTGEIIAQSSGKEGKVPINVIQGKLTRIQIFTEPPQIDSNIGSQNLPLVAKAGSVIIFKAIGYDSDVDVFGKTKPVNTINIKPEWSVNTKGLGTITSDGRFIGNEAIIGTIEAKDSNISSIFYIKVIPGELASIRVTPSTLSLISGKDKEQKFNAIGYDRYGNQITDIKPIWRVIGGIGEIDENGLLKVIYLPNEVNKISGKVVASYQKIEGSADVTIVSELGELARLQINIEPSVIEAGGKANCIVRGFDSVGNPITELSGLNISMTTWLGTLTLSDIPNNWTLRAVEKLPDNRQGLVSVSINQITAEAQFSLVPAPLSKIAIEPSSINIRSGEQTNFKASGFDVYGNSRQLQSVEWALLGGIGEIKVNPNLPQECLFQGTIAGKGQLVASSQSQEGRSELSVTYGEPESLVIQPKSITIESGKTQQFQVIIKDRYGNIVENAYIKWQVDQSIGSVTSEGIFTATKVGKGRINATYKDKIQDNAEITVVYGEISRIEISIEDNGIKLNQPYNLLSGNRYLLGVQAYDSQGNKIEKIEKINWKITEDRGLIVQSSNNESSFILTALFVGSGTISALINKASVTSDININPHIYNVSYSKGATIQGPLGIKLDIPPKALRNDEKITLSLTQSPGIIQKNKRIGHVLKIEPIGLILSVPAKLVLTYDYSDNIDIAEDRLSIYSWDKFQKKWIRSGGYVDKIQKAVIVEINYLSQFAIMQDEGESERRNENKIEVKLTPNAYFAPDINTLTINYNVLWKSYQSIDINICIYDMGGNLVKELIRSGSVFPGWNTAQWNGKNESGETVRNGRYFVVINAESNGEKISKTSHLAVFK